MTTSAYSSAFPPLQSWSMPHNRKHAFIQSPQPNAWNKASPLPPSNYPDYLKQTRYASLVSEQHQLGKQWIDLRLPQYWNRQDKSRHMEVGMNGLDLSYIYYGKQEDGAEPATVRTHFPIRTQCGVYYFEIKITGLGQDGLFAIGLCQLGHGLDSLPGHDIYSIGYHGQSGQILYQKIKRQDGPSFSSGDVIGCGVNFATGHVFFTKNGMSLPPVVFDSTDLYYPCVGLSTVGERVTANFGQVPFLFDIEHYIKEQQGLFYQSIQHYGQDRDTLHQLILSYLHQLGYTKTAKAFQPVSYEDKGYHTLRQAVMTGCLDLERLEADYPGLLASNPDLQFELKTRKFLDYFMHPNIPLPDLLEETDDLESLSTCTISHTSSDDSDSDNDSVEDPKPFTPPPPPPPPMHVAASGRRLSWAAIAASPNNAYEEPLLKRKFSGLNVHHQAMVYGQSLQEEYQHVTKYHQRLMELFCLLSATDPKATSEGHLLSLTARDAMASRLIQAVRVYQHQSDTSSLELAYQQTMVVTKELALSGHGKASFIHFNPY